jgi:hypothetical protein
MKKDKNRKLNFNVLSIIELNSKQLVVLLGATANPSTLTCTLTQSGPKNGYSTNCGQ